MNMLVHYQKSAVTLFFCSNKANLMTGCALVTVLLISMKTIKSNREKWG